MKFPQPTETEMISQLCSQERVTGIVPRHCFRKPRSLICPKCRVNPKKADGYCRECRRVYANARNH